MEVELCDNVSLREGPVAKWIRHLTTNQEIAGSSPARINNFHKMYFIPLVLKYHSPTITLVVGGN